MFLPNFSGVLQIIWWYFLKGREERLKKPEKSDKINPKERGR
jgi:cytoskeletal protein RodZ